MKPRASDTAWVGVGAVVSGLGGFTYAWLLARGTGPATTGVVLTLTTWFSLLSTVTKLGADTTLVREGGRIRARGVGADGYWVLKFVLRPAVWFTVATSLVAILASSWLADRWLTDSPDPVQPLIVGSAVVLPFATYTIAQFGYLRGLGSVGWYVAVEQVGKPALRSAGALLLAVLGIQAAGPYLATWLLPVLFGALVAWLVSRGSAPRTQDFGPDLVVERRRIRHFSSTRAASQVVDILNSSLGVIAVGAFATVEVAGQYAAAFRIVLAGQLAFQAVRLLVAPSLAAFHSSGEIHRVDEVFSAGSSLIVLLAWPAFLTCLAFPEQVLSLFGPGFVPAAPWLQVLAVSGLFLALVGNQGSVALMAGKGGDALKAVSFALAANAALTLGLVSMWGGMAAAVGWMVGIVVEGIWLAVVLRRLGIRPLPRSAIRSAALTLATFGTGLIALALLWPVSPSLAAMLGFASAIGWGVVLGRVGRSEFRKLTR